MLAAAALVGTNLGVQLFEGSRASKAARAAAEQRKRELAVDADRQSKALLAEAEAINASRLLAFERDALSQEAARRAEQDAREARGPALSLSRDEAFTRAARTRRRQSFFSQGAPAL